MPKLHFGSNAVRSAAVADSDAAKAALRFMSEVRSGIRKLIVDCILSYNALYPLLYTRVKLFLFHHPPLFHDR